MMRALDTLVARLILVSLLGITVVHVLSLWTYERALDRELGAVRDVQFAERLSSIWRSVMLVPEARREAVAHELSSGSIDAHWSKSSAATPGGPGVEVWDGLASRLREIFPELASEDLLIGTSTDSHVALLSIRLPDSSWLNVSVFVPHRAAGGGHGTFLSTSTMAVGVVILSLLIASWLTRPLRHIAHAAATYSPDDSGADVPEAGPWEVRQLAASFNNMRRRIADLISRRTQSLAAVSHDLRTPLTRLKLRTSDVENPELQSAIAADIDEMEQMIEATLSYLKGGETAVEPRPIDLVAVLETIVNDARDAGHDATLTAPAKVVVIARPIGLKRAVSNLINNALKFGSRAEIAVDVRDGRAIVTIDDNGPGIPEDAFARVFEPFVRLEESRNVETGGVGLGLTIAKDNIEADGGTLSLRNRPTGGLSAVVRLPVRKTPATEAMSPRVPGQATI
jgi:two-component system, OmpR family, sensor kinase